MQINFNKFLVAFTLYLLIAFILFYFFGRSSFFQSSENIYFDRLQNEYTIDSKDNNGYKKVENLLSNLVFINIDKKCFNTETDRVKKKCIDTLLSILLEHKSEFDMAFLDYDLSFLKQEDTLLLPKLEEFDQQLVTPKLLFSRSLALTIKNPIADSLIIKYSESKNTGNTRAYAYAWKKDFTHSYRYYLYRIFTTKLKTYNSIPYILAQKNWPSSNSPLEAIELDNFKELRFILRNKDIEDKERSVSTYSLSDFINEIPQKQLSKILNKKLLFIGLFDNYTNKYNQQPDSYTTPIGEHTSGILININAYLNLLMQNYIKQDSGFAAFILIFVFLVFGSLFWFLGFKSMGFSRKLIWFFVFVSFTIGGFLFASNIIWNNLNIRIHFLISIPIVLLGWSYFDIAKSYFKEL